MTFCEPLENNIKYSGRVEKCRQKNANLDVVNSYWFWMKGDVATHWLLMKPSMWETIVSTMAHGGNNMLSLI